MKKLQKNRDNKMISGVCAGLADYLNIDPTVMRVLWALFACVGGSGIFFYVLCAIIMPEG